MAPKEIVAEPTPDWLDYGPLSAEDEAQLVTGLIAGNPELAASDAPYLLATVSGDSPYSRLGRALEHRLFQQYFGNDPKLMGREYGPYEQESTFFIVVDPAKAAVAGVMRVIRPNDGPGQKSINDLPKLGITDLSVPQIYGALGVDPEKTIDVATIAVDREYSESKLGSPLMRAGLMRGLNEHCLQKGYDDVVAVIDEKPLDLLKSINLPILTSIQIKSPFRYLDAKANTFIRIPVGMVEASVSAKDRGVYDYVFGELALMGECQLSFSEQ